MPSRIVSIPFSDYGGPLFRDPDREKDVLLQFLQEHTKKVKYLEIRGILSQNNMFIRQNYYKRHILNLCLDPDVVRKNIDKRTVQYSIRKAKKIGVEIREENTTRGLQEFYRLNTLTRKKHGIPPQPIRFFQAIFDNMISRGCASIFLAIWDSKIIAAGLFLKFEKTIYYKYNASDPQYLSKQSPNHLLTWVAIKRACLEGFEFLDFGRTSPDNEGLMRYKQMWGATPLELPYYYYPKTKSTRMEGSRIYRILTDIWRMLPNGIVETIGPKLQKYVA
ncbi:MAG: lipid II:glycine glycyltransferase FemX [Candidatus Hodarchaeota archaeon]